jgi:glucokinase
MEKAWLVGVDIGGTKMLMLAENEDQREERLITTGPSFSGERAEAALRVFVSQLPVRPASIGIAVPGLVDDDGTVVSSDVLPLLARWHPDSSSCGAPVVMVNDAEAALWEAAAETESPPNMAVVVVGTAVGAAFRVNGQILRGASGWAGELGSLRLGSRDTTATIDEVAGGAAILRRLDVSIEELVELVGCDDRRALKAIADAGAALGSALAIVVNLFNPSSIVLGGGTLRWPGYVDAATNAARANTLPALFQSCSISVTSDHTHLVVKGALRVAAQTASSGIDDPSARRSGAS